MIMAKKETINTLEDEIKSLTRKKMQLILDADKLDKEILKTTEKYYELSPNHVQVECFQCSQSQYKGYVEDPNTGKNVKCPLCGSNAYLWMKLFKGDAK